MIEWRFGLDALTVRDASADNLAEALEFSGNPHKRLEVPHFNVPAGDFGGACPIITGAQNDNMLALLEMAGELGFKVGV